MNFDLGSKYFILMNALMSSTSNIGMWSLSMMVPNDGEIDHPVRFSSRSSPIPKARRDVSL